VLLVETRLQILVATAAQVLILQLLLAVARNCVAAVVVVVQKLRQEPLVLVVVQA
jgi:hypothetical protein